MESCIYDFTYIFTIVYFRTLYSFTESSDNAMFRVRLDESMMPTNPPTAILYETQKNLELVVRQVPIQSSITPAIHYLNADTTKQLRNQILLMLQVAHQKQVDSFVLEVSGVYCYEPVIQLLQQTLYKHKGTFRAIQFCCPDEKTKTLYQQIFNMAHY